MPGTVPRSLVRTPAHGGTPRCSWLPAHPAPRPALLRAGRGKRRGGGARLRSPGPRSRLGRMQTSSTPRSLLNASALSSASILLA